MLASIFEVLDLEEVNSILLMNKSDHIYSLKALAVKLPSNLMKT
jgi:hypothetical protein